MIDLVNKTLIFVFGITCLIDAGLGKTNIPANPQKDYFVRKLHVTEIAENDKAYIITVQDSAIFVIVSLKTNNLLSCSAIQVGEAYEFNVTPYFEFDYVHRPELRKEVCVEGVCFYVPMIGSNVLLTSSLLGLCYCEEKN